MKFLLINMVLSVFILIGETVMLIQRTKCVVWVRQMLQIRNAPPRKLTTEFEVTAIAIMIMLMGLMLTFSFLYYIVVIY